MAKSGLYINSRDLKDLGKQINDAVEKSADDTYRFYKKTTPIDKGNARRNTRYKKTTKGYDIVSDYAYGKRLDDGWSAQAPKGMTLPSLAFFDRMLTKYFKRIR